MKQQTVRRHDVPLRPSLDYRGLAQVCREIRREFQALYRATKVVCVSIKDVLDYLQAVYPAHNPSRSASQAYEGKVIVVVEDTREKPLVRLHNMPAFRTIEGYQMPPGSFRPCEPIPKEIDLLPILKHCLLTRNIDISFVGDITDGGLDNKIAEYARNFNVWFRGHRDEWKKTIAMDLDALLFRYKYISPIELVFKAHPAEIWVVEVMKDAQMESEGREAYYCRLGFRKPDHDTHPIVSQEDADSSGIVPLAAMLKRSFGVR